MQKKGIAVFCLNYFGFEINLSYWAITICYMINENGKDSEMSKNKEFEDFYEDFEDTELTLGYDLSDRDSKVLTKQEKTKSKKNARRRVEDYIERRALKRKMVEWETV